MKSTNVGKPAFAALLGLPAALLAHFLTFGGDHTVAGSFHGLALSLGLALGFLGALIAAIAAVRRWPALPIHFASIACAGAAWFAAIESCERSHSISLLTCALALALASWLVGTVLSAFAKTIVAIVAVFAATFASAARHAARIRYSCAPAPLLAHTLRLFSRPPPAFA